MKKSTIGKLAAFFIMLVGIVALTVQMTAKAGAIDAEQVAIDYVNETLTVTVEENTDTVIYFTDKYNKDVTKWDACEVRDGKAAFDISWINAKKTVRLYLCGDVNQEVISVDITWEEDFGVDFTGTLLTTDITEAKTWQQVYKEYPKFTEDTGYFIFTLEENGRDKSYFALENIQWRKGDDGVWREYKELDLKEMNIKGIKLEFRIVANEVDRASSTAKIEVDKLDSAPALTVNPNTMTVSIRNNMEFSFDKEEWIMVPEYNKKFGGDDYLVDEATRAASIETIYTNQRITTLMMQEILKAKATDFTMNTSMSKENLTAKYADLFEFTENGIVVYVREIGTSRNAASKIAKAVIPYASDNMAVPEENALSISYGESKTNTGGIVVANNTPYKYQIGVITPEEWAKVEDTENINLTNTKWTSIKPGNMLKLSNKKVPSGSYLVYRIAGENGQLPSTYRVYGPMEYKELTFAGIAPGKKTAGETLSAMVSTNLTLDDPSLSYQWQISSNIKVPEPVWEDIPGATEATFKLTNEQSSKYIRVVITNRVSVGETQKVIVLYSEPEGPVAYAAIKEEPEDNTGDNTEVTE